MDEAGIPSGIAAQRATLENSQHGSIAFQDVGNDLSQASVTSDGDEVAHERLPDSLSLAFVGHEESRLGLARSGYDVAASSRDHPSATFLHGNERNVVDEVYVQKVIRLILAETALR